MLPSIVMGGAASHDARQFEVLPQPWRSDGLSQRPLQSGQPIYDSLSHFRGHAAENRVGTSLEQMAVRESTA